MPQQQPPPVIRSPLPCMRPNSQSYPPQQTQGSAPPPSYGLPPPSVDPSRLPQKPIFTRPLEGSIPVHYTKSSEGPSPPADSRYLVVDDGNASPDLLRSTVYNFPQNRSVWHATGDLPLAVVCTPMAIPLESPRPRVLPSGQTERYEPLQRVPRVAGNPVRCARCAAYPNPYFGTEGTCNLCGYRNPRSVQQGLVGPAVQFGTIDYAVDGPYVTRDTAVQPAHVYAVDLTCPHLLAYIPILAQVGQDMAEHYCRRLNTTTTPRMGVVFVSSMGTVLYGREDGRYWIIPDVREEPFSPLPVEEWTFELSSAEGLDAWQRFCTETLAADLPTLKQDAMGKNSYGVHGGELSCGGAALGFLSSALAVTGGRGTLISWRRPNFGAGAVSHRAGTATTRGEAKGAYLAYTPLQDQTSVSAKEDGPAAAYYRKIADECVANRVSLDILVHTQNETFLDLATLGRLSHQTSGRLIWLTGVAGWQSAFREELRRSIEVDTAWDASFKIRCSDGIQIKSYLAPPGSVVEETLGSSPELDLASLSSSTSIVVGLDHRVGGIPKDRKFVYIQSALLFSTASGKRFVRVSTLALRTSTSLSSIFHSVDFASVAAALTRESLERLKKITDEHEGDLWKGKTRDALYQRTVNILSSYRKNTIVGPGVGRGNLLDRLDLLPLFVMSLIKSPLLRPGVPRRHGSSQAVQIAPSPDERSFFIYHASNVNPAFMFLLVHPNLFSVNDLRPVLRQSEIRQHTDGSQLHSVHMPPLLPPSVESLREDEVVLIDNGLRIYVVAGKSAPDELRRLTLDPDELLRSPAGQLVWQMRSYNSIDRGSENDLRPLFSQVIGVTPVEGRSTSMATDVLDMSVADAVAGEKDYAGFFAEMDRQIQIQVAAKK